MSMLDGELLPGVEATAYLYSPLHQLNAADAHRSPGANIGRNGRNLTITFLSMNRANLSTRLLASLQSQLPGFGGEVLIVDQGSAAEELAQLQTACADYGQHCRIVELGANYGVAGGRNRTMPHVRTDWVMCLDNDMVFVADPIYPIHVDLAQLGCHFLNLPLLNGDRRTLFARGGHLYTDILEGQVRIGGGSAYRPDVYDGRPGRPFLSTFLFGGASVMKVETFQALGGYDEGMFIGFEDIDFSLRLFQAGYKIGNTGVVALVHDHPAPESGDDAAYERQRFSRETLKRSAEYLQAKHGMAIWNPGVDEWLAARRRELGLDRDDKTADTTEPATPAPSVPAEPRARPRVTLMVDDEGWAFWNISQQLIHHLSGQFEFKIITTTSLDNPIQAFLAASGSDLVHVFWREFARQLLTEHCRHYVYWMGLPYERVLQEVVRPLALSTCIYDHLWLEPEALTERRPLYADYVDAYYVGSRRLEAIYRTAPGYPPPAAVLSDGVDATLFAPRALERFATIGQRPIVVGWVGNSQWGDGREDYKGVQTILKPAIAALQDEGMAIQTDFVDRAEGRVVPHHRMADYYAGIDVYLCTSLVEGTPNPVLESMTCGVPVISTDVGIVPEAFGQQQQAFILAERSVACLKETLRRLVTQPALFRTLSEENLAQARAWTWNERVKGFQPYFEACIERRHRRRARNGATA
jgi:glycosyltransferase involved in cell wall biosynthesis/GT2 family glycosyltransferase